jgi:hypothetical protein
MDFETSVPSLTSARDLPGNKSLSAALNAAVERPPTPRNRFYERMALTVGDTALMALQDNIEGRACMHVLSAPAGSGKTTLTNAFIEAMIEVVPLASTLVVVEQIKSVEARFRDLDALLPGNVACWTSEFRCFSVTVLPARWQGTVRRQARDAGAASQLMHAPRPATASSRMISSTAPRATWGVLAASRAPQTPSAYRRLSR